MTKLIIIMFASAAILSVGNVAEYFFVNHNLKGTIEYEIGILIGIGFFGSISCILDAYKKD